MYVIIRIMAKGIKTGGRKKGTPNKLNKEVRLAYKELVEKNLENMDLWLIEVAKENPAKAIDLVIKLSDFFLPKLKHIQHETNDLEKFEIPVIQFVSQGLAPEEYRGGKRVYNES